MMKGHAVVVMALACCFCEIRLNFNFISVPKAITLTAEMPNRFSDPKQNHVKLLISAFPV
jgi:hypothetical protein